MATHNWARNVAFGHRDFAVPSTTQQLGTHLSGSGPVKAVGAGHSFNDIADTSGTLMDLGDLDGPITIDESGRQVTAPGGVRYHVLNDALHEAGWALHNLQSIPHFSVAGACSTATHGSGDSNAALATAVAGVELLLADGSRQRFDRDDVEFGGIVTSLGALGLITELTLDVQPTFDMASEVLLELPLGVAIAEFDTIMASAYSVSWFTDWQGEFVNQLWRKHRLDDPRCPETSEAQWDARPADRTLSPSGIAGAELMTPQLLSPGPWHERLPHVSPKTPLAPAGELQSEYFLDRAHAPDALRTVADLSDTLAPVIRMAEVRTVAADDLWLSPFHSDTLALHFSWNIDAAGLDPVLARLESALAEFDALPHWGKIHHVEPDTLRAGYPDFDRWAALRDRLDPDRRFVNPHLAALLA